MTRAEKRQSQPGPGNFHDVEAASGGYFRVGLGRCWALVGVWKRLPGWDAEQVLQKAENSLWAAGAWGGETKCHSVHMGNLFSVAKGAPLACRQHRPEWPQGLAYSSDLAQTSGFLSWNPHSQALLVLFCVSSKLGHSRLPSVWEKQLDSDAGDPLGFEGPCAL